MRIKKEVVQNQFKRLCDALGKRVAKDYNDVGAWRLDCVNIYGGYTIEEIISDKGGVTHPLGNNRIKASEFYEMINFALRSIQLDRLNGQDSAQYWPSDKLTTENNLTAH